MSIGLALAAAVLLVVGAPTPTGAADLEGVSGPIAWRAGDIQQNTTTIGGMLHSRHELTLVLKNVGARPVTLVNYEASFSYVGLTLTDSTVYSLGSSLLQGRELRITLQALLGCPDASKPCRFVVGPRWRIDVVGRDAADAAFTAPIDVTLPAESGRPVVRYERVRIERVTPAPSSGSGLVPASFTNRVITIPASMNGRDLRLLLDTWAHVCRLRPDTATRLGLSVPTDAPPIPELPIPGDGILGANFIELFRMTVDYRGKQLYLELGR